MEQFKNKKNIIAGVTLVSVALVAFYCGTLYPKSRPISRDGFPMMDGQSQRGGLPGVNTRGTRGMMGGVVMGEIIAKDATSITVKAQDGSSKIVLVGGSTQVAKSAAGTQADLVAGTNVTVVGTSNTDGSVTAQSVQIRPEGAGLPGRQY